MAKLEELKSAYVSKALAADTLFLLRLEDAIEFILRGNELGLHLLGVEGFRVTSAGGYQPVQEASNDIVDYAGKDFVEDTIEFVRSQPVIFWYQVVFSDSLT
jgi:hypothetical protein